MATKKISALTTGTTANAADKLPIERSGANNYITPAMIATYTYTVYGLLARYHNSAALTYANGATTVINFNTLDYDPGTLVTTGAAWHFTAPVTGWYDVRLCAAFVDPNGFAWANSGDGIGVQILKNGSAVNNIAYWDAEGSAGVDHFPFLVGTYSVSLAATNTLAFEFDNFSGQARKLGSAAAIEIHRVH